MHKHMNKIMYRSLATITSIAMLSMASINYVNAEETEVYEADMQEVYIEEEIIQEENIPEESIQEEIISDESTQDGTIIDEVDDEILNATDYVDNNGFHFTLRRDAYYEVSGYTGYSTYLTIPQYFNGEEVISIAADFLNGNTSVTSVTLPDTIVEIGARAFKNCTNLSSFNIGKTNAGGLFQNKDAKVTTQLRRINESAFEGDINLREIDLSPEGLTYIGKSAFSGCSGIATLKLTKTVTNIGAQAFYGCKSLNYIQYGGDLDSWMSIVYDSASSTDLEYASHPNYFATQIKFAKRVDEGYGYFHYEYYEPASITIPSGVTSIGNYCFANFRNLGSIDLSGITSIGMGAFENCTSLSTVTLTDRLNSLGAKAFYNDSSLTQVYLGTGLKNIPAGAFGNCSQLREISVLNNVSSISADSFNGCNSLTTVNVVYNSYAHNYFKAKSSNYVFKFINGSGTPSVEDNVIDGVLTGYSVAYDGTIGLRFYFKLSSDIVNDSRAYVRFVLPTDNGATVYKDVKISEATVSNSEYIFTAYIAPKYADVKIGAKIVRGNGSESKLYQISYLDYVKALMSTASDSNAGVVNVAKALLTYCDASQKYFGYHAGSIPSGFLLGTGEMSSCTASMYAPNINDAGYIGASLLLNSSMGMKFYFEGHRDDISFQFLETSVNPSSYVSVEYIGNMTVFTVSNYIFGVAKRDYSKISMKKQVNILSNGNVIGSTYGPYSYFYLAANSGNSALKYVGDSMYTLNVYSGTYVTDSPIKK